MLSRIVRSAVVVVMAAMLAVPGVASAATAQPKVTRVVVDPSSLGPAHYSGSSTMRGKVGIRGAGDRIATGTIQRFSWVGVWLYTLTVNGYYHSNGNAIDFYGATLAPASANGWTAWVVAGTSAGWTVQQPTWGNARANGTFNHNLIGGFGGVVIQVSNDTVDGFAWA